jgi:hypothetical protein
LPNPLARYRAGKFIHIELVAVADTEREILQTPQVKAQLAKDADAKALADAAEAELKTREIVAEGTPEAVVKVAASYTGHYLKPLLERAS